MTHEHEHEHDTSTSTSTTRRIRLRGAVEDERADKDDWLQASPSSPLPARDPPRLQRAPILRGRRALRFEGLQPRAVRRRRAVALPDPDLGWPARPAHRAGTFSFERDGAPLALTAYVLDAGGESDSLFVPFLDATSGHETYGAGRYLDLEPDGRRTYALDFNLAYHPNCVFSERYFSCPLTPAENRLPIRIEAGERLAEDAPLTSDAHEGALAHPC